MITYRVPPTSRKTQIYRAFTETCLPLASQALIFRQHRPTLNGLVGEGVIIFVSLFLLHFEEPYDLEVDDDGIREMRNGQVKRRISSAKVKHVKESGWGWYRNLVISESGPLSWLGLHRLTVPARAEGYEEIKMRVANWLEHPRATPSIESL